MLFGPEAGLNVVDALTAEPALKTYHLLPSVRGDLLRSSAASTKPASNSGVPLHSRKNERERALLLDLAAACAAKSVLA